MDNLEVKLDSNGQIAFRCRPIFRKELKKLLKNVSDDARMLVQANNTRTGALRRSIKPGPIKGVNQYRITGTVTAGSRLAPYAKYVHDGTKRHIIKPRHKKTLMWLGKEFAKDRVVTRGKTLGSRRFGKPGEKRGYRDFTVSYEYNETNNFQKVFPRWVDHPGYRGHPFLWRAAAKNVTRRGGKVSLPQGSGRVA